MSTDFRVQLLEYVFAGIGLFLTYLQMRQSQRQAAGHASTERDKALASLTQLAGIVVEHQEQTFAGALRGSPETWTDTAQKKAKAQAFADLQKAGIGAIEALLTHGYPRGHVDALCNNLLESALVKMKAEQPDDGQIQAFLPYIHTYLRKKLAEELPPEPAADAVPASEGSPSVAPPQPITPTPTPPAPAKAGA